MIASSGEVKLYVSLAILVITLIVVGIVRLARAAGGTPPPPAPGPGAPPPPGPGWPPPRRDVGPDGRVWGSGLMLTGAIGAFMMAVVLALPLVLFLGEGNMRDGLGLVIGLDLVTAGAWVCIGLGAVGAVRRTNGYAINVAVFAWIAALFTLPAPVLMGAGGDTGQFFALVGFAAPYVALLFFAIWGFAGVRGFGLGLGLSLGFTGVFGSLAGLVAMMSLADSWRHVRSDGFKLFLLCGVGLGATSLLIGGIGLAGRLRRKPIELPPPT